jgi:taspase (threonine aspartase 1)
MYLGCTDVLITVMRHYSAWPACCPGHVQRLVSAAAAAAWREYRGMLEDAAAANSSNQATAAASPTASPEQQQQQQQQQQRAVQPKPSKHEQQQGSLAQPPAKRSRIEPAAQGDPGSPQQQQARENGDGSNGAAPAAAALCGDMADTVGCVAVDAAGRVAAGVSSGGLAMKQQGRVGEAAVVGAGCWAANGHWRQLMRDPAAAAAEQGGEAGATSWQQPGELRWTAGGLFNHGSCGRASSDTVSACMVAVFMPDTDAGIGAGWCVCAVLQALL